MMYSRHGGNTDVGSWKRKTGHWNNPGERCVGQGKKTRDFTDCKKTEDADGLFKRGMVALMQGKLKKAKKEFNLCLSHNPAHRQAPGHLEVAEFCSTSQRVANATIKFLHESGKAHRFNVSGVAKIEFDAKDFEETKAEMKRGGFDPESAAAAFGMGRAYLAFATEEKPGWKICAISEFERALSLLGNTRAEKCMAAAVHRIYAQAEGREFHMALMRELDPHIPDDWSTPQA